MVWIARNDREKRHGRKAYALIRPLRATATGQTHSAMIGDRTRVAVDAKATP
ncbi:hypothetical protein MicloDRAFT_00055500 [Microvirga lotononidis]|uniref:Uncharacterized protein n=1 Tax=Microvirga lotononidis TaxID=864069 RepID=I4YLI9_9HYPH|nr:hypothetical protein MicloDRAFT_00055500 [Microvirga lotononidis]